MSLKFAIVAAINAGKADRKEETKVQTLQKAKELAEAKKRYVQVKQNFLKAVRQATKLGQKKVVAMQIPYSSDLYADENAESSAIALKHEAKMLWDELLKSGHQPYIGTYESTHPLGGGFTIFIKL